MRKIFTVICLLLMVFITYSQKLETIGAGVLDFLIDEKSSTSKKFNGTEQAAMRVIGNLLNKSANRKHDLNVANAGRREIILNTNTGVQATLYADKEGKLYLLYNGLIHPISSSLVERAKSENGSSSIETPKEIENSTLNAYNIEKLKTEYAFDKTEKFTHEDTLVLFTSDSKKEYLVNIARRYDISVDDIYFQPFCFYKGERLIYERRYSIKEITDMYKSSKERMRERIWERYYNSKIPFRFLNSGDSMVLSIYKNALPFFKLTFEGVKKPQKPVGYFLYVKGKKKKSVYEYKLDAVTIFTCNWVKDFEGNGLDFDDFQGLKRSFSSSENILFVCAYTSKSSVTWELEVFNASTGETCFNSSGNSDKGANVISESVKAASFPKGVYVFNFKLISEDKKVSKSERFEIIKEI
ncbi:MAG: hypothetical protein COC06_08140 [Bacteroidales bacterium]|nr:MAG: hypothetical protein COC06_08140 [Bacteroidales bacterium]